MIQILLVEDDPVLGRGLVVNLELEKYQVQWVKDLKSAYETNEKSKLDLVILDLGLPDGSGFQFLQKIRDEDSRLPVIILTAQTDEDSVVHGLQSGANDYVKKPFGNRELLARIKTVLREPLSRDKQIRFEDILLLIDSRKVMAGEKEIELNRREFDILHHFLVHADKVVTRENLLSTLDKDGEIFDRTIDSHVSHLRSKLKQAGVSTVQISSVYGVGYRLEKK